jgi:hypothetical protein
MDQAKARTELNNFGDDSFREGLDILLRSLDREARFTDAGREQTDAQIVNTLAQRLQIEDWYARHPEIEEQQIIAPLIGLGLPRTGSTAFSCLLAEDPAVRSIRTWEAMTPVPPPEKDTEDSDPRIEAASQGLAQRDKLFPRLKLMLPMTANTPSECVIFQTYDFKSYIYVSQARVPTYLEWLNHKADLVPTFQYVKRVLKLLQWRRPPVRWRLKNPANIVFMSALDKVFPDARFWMTHRNVASVLPSVADLHYELARAYSDDVDKNYLGQNNMEIWELGMHRLLAFRDAGNEHRFFDVHFKVFQRDPFPTMERLYDFLGEKLTDIARSRMQTWREQTPREKHGEHTYQAADYGLDENDLTTRFQFYHERFGVLEA